MHKFPDVKSKVFLAPMAGINDIAFRLLCRENGAGAVYTEMASANALSRNHKATEFMLESVAKERPVIVQLFGQNSDHFAKAARLISERHHFDAIDINFGCPATKIIKEGCGSALMNRPNKIGEIIYKTVNATNLPVTAKLRAGINFKNIVAPKLAKIMEDNGASAIAIHGRVAIQGYAGVANWQYIKDVKDAVNIPVIGNGDITSPESAKKMIDETGCDYVMIGRAARGNPLLFKQCDDYLKTGKYEKYTINDQIRMLNRYLDHAKKLNVNFKYIKVQANYFTKGIMGGAMIRDKLARVQTIDEVRELFKNIDS
ncbi:MAG: tRNA dihydrouridine synthase DusB [Candidatus Woesearchaeota archaeon]